MCSDMNQKYRKKGFTMVETVIAFGVLVAAILGPVTLVAFSLAQAQSSQNKLIATNLAQEGVELVRAIRENNVICDTLSSHPPPVAVAWNANPAGGQDLGQGSNNYFTVDANDMTPVNGDAGCGISISSFSTPLPRPTTSTACSGRALNLDANGVYTYGPGTPTLFRRCVMICVPASSSPCNEPFDSDAGNATDQMEVISTVFWKDKHVEFRERLYNWR